MWGVLLELSELKRISAGNIIKLRTDAGLTQAELGAMLNYSDKTISKWERGEAIPDAYVLTQMAEIFGVTVDNILSSGEDWKASAEPYKAEKRYRVDMIITIAVLGVWTIALTVFVSLWLSDILWWETFVVALPVAILTRLILNCVFGKRKYLQFVIAAFVLSIFVMLYFLLPEETPWQLFLIAIPAEIIVFLSCNLKKRPEVIKKIMKN